MKLSELFKKCVSNTYTHVENDGDYLAFWSPAKGRLAQTRAVVPLVLAEQAVRASAQTTLIKKYENTFAGKTQAEIS